MTLLLYAAAGAAFGLGVLVLVVNVMRVREETLRAALYGDFLERTEQWGDQPFNGRRT